MNGSLSSAGPDFVCPLCKEGLLKSADSYSCPECKKSFPVVLQIPDFRVFSDPYISMEADREKASGIDEKSKETDFEGLVDYYYSITDDVSLDLARRYKRHISTAVKRAETAIREIERECSSADADCGPLLDIGCGAGALLVAAQKKGRLVVGGDIAMRWLVIARKRIEETGASTLLFCACAEHLPFKTESFGIVTAVDVFEHMRDPGLAFLEAGRVTRKGGRFFACAPNRFSIYPEPHVRLWGVGFLPRDRAISYVKARRGINYHIRMLSYFELRRKALKAGFGNLKALLPEMEESEKEGLGFTDRMAVRLYSLIRAVPVLKLILYLFGPFIYLVGKKPPRS